MFILDLELSKNSGVSWYKDIGKSEKLYKVECSSKAGNKNL